VMATEELTADRPSLDRVLEALDLAGTPPQGLAAAVSWDEGDGARARADGVPRPDRRPRGEWSERVMMPLFESGQLGPAGEAMTHPGPVLAWVRP
jgi:hypothetical protein